MKSESDKDVFGKDFFSLIGSVLAFYSLSAYYDGRLLSGLLAGLGFFAILHRTKCINCFTTIEDRKSSIGAILILYGTATLILGAVGFFKGEAETSTFIGIVLLVVALAIVKLGIDLARSD